VSDTERLLKQALEHHNAGRVEAAGWLYKAILAIDSEHVESNYNLGLLELESGNVESGLERLRKAVERAPRIQDHWIKYAEALLVSQRPEEALKVIERAKTTGLQPKMAEDFLLRIRESVDARGSSRANSKEYTSVGLHGLQAGTSIYTSWAPRDFEVESFIVNIEGDVNICVPADIHCETTYVLLEQENWYEPELTWLRHYIQPGMSVLDVGAGYGIYALTVGKILKDKGCVLAFESDQMSSALLERSIVENELEGQISLIRAGLSDRPGEIDISIPSAHDSAGDGSGELAQLVQILTLDDLVKQIDWPRDSDFSFMRLNAKGFENKILHGGHEFFAQYSPLVMFGVDSNTISSDLAEMFIAFGMSFYRLIHGLNALASFDTSGSGDVFQRNIFACCQKRAKLLRNRGLLI